MPDKLPIYESQLASQPAGNAFFGHSIDRELQAVAQDSQKINENVISLGLQNALFDYKQLAHEQILNAYEKYPDDPTALHADLQEKYDSLISGMPFSAKEQATEWFNTNAMGFVSKARTNEVTVLNDQLTAKSLNAIDGASKRINFFAKGLLDPNVDTATKAATTSFAAYGEIFEAMSAVGADGKPLFSEVQKVKTLDKIKGEWIKSGLRGQFDSLETIEEQLSFLKQFETNGLAIPFMDIEGNPQTIRPAYELDRGNFESERAYMTQTINAAAKKKDKMDYTERILRILNKKEDADPADPNLKKAVNDYYTDTIRPLLKEMDTVSRVDTMIDYAKTLETLPTTMANEMKSWVMSGNEEQTKTACMFIGKMRYEFPAFISQLTTEEAGRAFAISDQLDSGNSYKNAKEYADKLYHPFEGSVYQAREKAFNKDASGGRYNFDKMSASAIKKGFFGFGRAKFPEDTIIPEQASIAYKNLYMAALVLNDNPKKAEEIANAQFASTWGISESNFNRAMKYPPESRYVVAGMHEDWIRPQIETSVKSYADEHKLEIDEKTAFLVSDETTKNQVENGFAPTYLVYANNDMGIPVPLTDDKGKLLRWHPDLAKGVEERLRIKEERERKLREQSEQDYVFKDLNAEAMKLVNKLSRGTKEQVEIEKKKDISESFFTFPLGIGL